jgi:flagellar motility protein MotE (MotC chaperone)
MKSKAGLLTLLFSFVFLLFFPHQQGWGQALETSDVKKISSVEERRILVSLQKERARLMEREKLLTMKEMELKTLHSEVDKKLDELKSLREELLVLLGRKDEEEAKRIQELSKMYEKMDPVQAASLLASLEEELAIGILSGMKSRSAGKVLNNIEKQKAARLSEAFSTLNTN